MNDLEYLDDLVQIMIVNFIFYFHYEISVILVTRELLEKAQSILADISDKIASNFFNHEEKCDTIAL
jgi:hypothetical protein